MEVATSFENILRLLQIKMTSSVILECFTELDGRFEQTSLLANIYNTGVQFICPVEFLSPKKMRNVQETLEEGLEKILSHGERVSNQRSYLWKKKKKLCQEVQDKIDPYLSTFYDVYSMASYHTKPFVNPMADAPQSIEFMLNTSYISEGEEDNVKVE